VVPSSAPQHPVRMHRTVEDVLRRVTDQAALLRFVADAAAASREAPTPSALSGLADLCDDLETSVRAVRDVLSVEALCIELKTEASPARLRRARKFR
jgi:hypothetical protein